MNLINRDGISILRRHFVERLWIVLPALVGATELCAAGSPQFVNAGFEGTDPLGMDGGTIRITAERSSKLPVDAKQGGQFIEPLCNLIPSMLAQQVGNTSFEDEPPWKVAFRREIDKPHRPWYPDGAVHVARFAFDTHQPFNGQRSQRIEIPASGVRAGISQDGFFVEKGRTYRLRFHARSDGHPRVRATLHGGGGALAQPLIFGPCRDDWEAMEGTFRPKRPLENATLTLDFVGPHTLWLDRVSFISDDAVLGLWRPDVVKALRGLKPSIIRFGGSTIESYDWQGCIGPAGKRAPYALASWGGLEENFVGAEEVVALCREVGAEPLICLRWTGRKPVDAAAEVEYFNGAATTKWGALRAQNGHAEPWRVKYWQIGNEVEGDAYDTCVSAFSEAMRKVDSNIRVLSALPSTQTLRLAAGLLDYLCPHHYDCADLAGTERNILKWEKQISESTASRPVRLAVTEWNTTAGDWNLRRARLQTLENALACSRYHHLMHRHADSMEIAIRSNLIDSFGSGVIVTGPGWIYFTPTYYAQQLYARGAGSFPVRTQQTTRPSEAPPMPFEELDLSALLSGDGRTLRLYGINTTGKHRAVKTQLAGFASGVKKATAHILKGSQASPTPEIFNTRDEPDRVRVFKEERRLRGNAFNLTFDAYSVTLYELELERGHQVEPPEENK